MSFALGCRREGVCVGKGGDQWVRGGSDGVGGNVCVCLNGGGGTRLCMCSCL